MSENKENKKGFWATLFAPKKKSSCCCGGSNMEYVIPAHTEKSQNESCGCNQSSNAKKSIKVLGTGCSSCKTLYATVQSAVEELGLDATVEKEENLDKIMAYNVMSLPALVVDEKVVSKGQKLTLEQVKKLIK